jgi:CheY-like chemotaxis protein
MKNKFKSVLLIDDKVADNRYNQIILQRMNIIDKIEIAESGIDALKMIVATDYSQPKLILLDINMPKMNGWEFLEVYEKLDATIKNNNVVIIFTTSMNPEDKQKASKISCVSELHIKPLTPEMFKNIIEKYSSN